MIKRINKFWGWFFWLYWQSLGIFQVDGGADVLRTHFEIEVSSCSGVCWSLSFLETVILFLFFRWGTSRVYVM